VITVGAVDIGGTKTRNDDVQAPWSAYGRTLDGFMKPDLAAPGRYMVGPVPVGSTLSVERADKIVTPGYIQLSGTSFAAPVVAGAAAQILAKHPEFTPDQVKGALMVATKPVDDAPLGAVGVGELQMGRSALVLRPPNPNKALEQFVKPDPSGDSLPAFDSVSWLDTAKANVSWDSVSWTGRLLDGCLVERRLLGGACPGSRSRGPMFRGQTSPGQTCPGTMPPTRTRPRETPAATRTATS